MDAIQNVLLRSVSEFLPGWAGVRGGGGGTSNKSWHRGTSVAVPSSLPGPECMAVFPGAPFSLLRILSSSYPRGKTVPNLKA